MSRKCLCCVVLLGSQIQHLQADDLRIFIVDRAQTPPLVLDAALRQASRLLADAGAKSSWKLCPASSILAGSRPCAKTGSLAFTLRLLPSNEAEAWPLKQNS